VWPSISIVLVAIVISGSCVVLWRYQSRPPCLLRRVMVNTVNSNETFQAVLWSTRGPWLTLRDVEMMANQGVPVKVPGEVVLHRDRVTFMQVF
jgi:hypothetical protein